MGSEERGHERREVSENTARVNDPTEGFFLAFS